MWKELLAYFTKQFIKAVGRRPQTTKELMSIQDDVVRYLNKTKGVPEGPKKPPFQGFTPKVIEGGKSKEGIGTLLKDSPEAIAKMKADNKAAIKRLQEKKKTVEDFRDDGDFDPGGMASGGMAREKFGRGYLAGGAKSLGKKYKGSTLQALLENPRLLGAELGHDGIASILSLFGFSEGGRARVGMFGGGRLVKGASWVINKLKEQLFDLDLGIGGSRFSKISSTQKDFYKKELNTLIKQLEQGGEIPNEMLDTMIADPKFKSVVKTRSTDKDLFELEGALLDRQAGKQSDELFDAEGKLNKKAVLQEVKDSEEKMLLDKFDVKDRTKQASGGRAGSGLNYLLGEDDQNVRTPYGGVPGLLGE